MGGDDDPIIPLANPRLQARLIPAARLHVYRGGHLAILTEADELAPVVERLPGRAEPERGDTVTEPTSGHPRTPPSPTSSASSCCSTTPTASCSAACAPS